MSNHLCLLPLAICVGLIGFAQAKEDARPLAVGASIERELAGGQAHTYQIELETGHYFRVIARQRGIDVVVILQGTDGKQLYQMDSPNGTEGEEVLSWVTRQTGQYRVIVRSFDEKAKAGRYEIQVEELRRATPQDESRIAGERALVEGERLYGKQTAETSSQALKFFEEAAKSFHEAGDRKREADAFYSISAVHQSLGGIRQALEFFNQSLPLYREANDRAGEARTLVAIGAMHFYLGEYRRALEYSEQTLPIWRELNAVAEEASTLSSMGVVYASLAEYQQALDHYDRSLLLIRSSDRQTQQFRESEAVVLLNICGACTRLGEMQRALDACQQSLLLYRQLGYRSDEAVILNRTALVFNYLGESEKSLEYNQESLRLLRLVGDRRQEAITVNDLGMIHYGRGDYSQAIEYYQQSLQLAKEVNNSGGQVVTLHNLGVSYSLLGEKEKALDCFTQALALARALGDRQSEAKTLISLGRLYQLSGDNRKAVEHHRQALQLCRTIKARPEEAYALLHFAQANRELGNLVEALAQSEEALKITESLRTSVTSPELRSSFFASVMDRYDFHIDTLMQMHRQRPNEGRAMAAFEVSERARARGLLELLAEAHADIRQGVDPALLQKERAMRQRLNAKAAAQTRLLSGKYAEAQAADMAKEIADSTSQLNEVEVQIRNISPRYAAMTQPQPLTLAEIQKQVLDGDTLLLEYALGEDRSYLWAVTSSSLSSYELPNRAEIQKAARQVTDLLTARSTYMKGETGVQRRQRVVEADARLPAAARQLSQIVLGPAASLLSGKRLLVVPDGALQYVSFAMLPVPVVSGPLPVVREKNSSHRPPTTDFRPLIIEHEVITLPSASTLAVMRKELASRKPAQNAVAMLADPVFSVSDERIKGSTGKSDAEQQNLTPATEGSRIIEHLAEKPADPNAKTSRLVVPRLPFTRKEADQILAVASRMTNLKAVDFKASKATVTGSELGKYRYVHFATHGLLDSERPGFSALVLSMVDEQGKPQDGFLRANEIYNLNLRAELVVLSACQTGLGKEIKGEGLVGLTRGFMYAGAARVVVSLWNVNDKATSELMTKFYQKMLKENQRPAAALRAAQVEMFKQKEWQAPYYWAAFVLQGEWR